MFVSWNCGAELSTILNQNFWHLLRATLPTRTFSHFRATNATADVKWTRCRRSCSVCVVLWRGLRLGFFSSSLLAPFSVHVRNFMQRGVGEQSPNFKLWGQHSGPDLDVMDNPSSVITQVSRDDEGNRGAAERGECPDFCPAWAHVRGEGEKKKKEKEKVMQLQRDRDQPRQKSRKFALLGLGGLLHGMGVLLKWSLNGRKCQRCSVLHTFLRSRPFLACDESGGSDVIMLAWDGLSVNKSKTKPRFCPFC